MKTALGVLVFSFTKNYAMAVAMFIVGCALCIMPPE
jgi:hypothetical protein